MLASHLLSGLSSDEIDLIVAEELRQPGLASGLDSVD